MDQTMEVESGENDQGPTMDELLEYIILSRIAESLAEDEEVMVQEIELDTDSDDDVDIDMIASAMNRIHSVRRVPIDQDLMDAISQSLDEPQVLNLPRFSKEEIDSLPFTEAPQETGLHCTVCLENFIPLEKLVKLPCEHYFHKVCLSPWLAMRSSCPNCRNEVKLSEMK